MSKNEPRQPIIQLGVENELWQVVVLDLGTFSVFEARVPDAVVRLRQLANLLEREITSRIEPDEFERCVKRQIAETRARLDAEIRVRGPKEKAAYRVQLEELAGLFGDQVSATREARKPRAAKERAGETTAERRARLRSRRG